jgi:flagellar protein FlaI
MDGKRPAPQKKVVDFWEGIEVKPLPHDYDILSRYSIREGLADVVIAAPPGKFVGPTYFCSEVPLNDKEKEVVEKVK